MTKHLSGMKLTRVYYLLCLLLISSACSVQEEKQVFEKISSQDSGIEFVNQITNTPDFNILNYMYFNNGGGVSTEDFNGDGLIDIFFTSNQDSNRLYLNKGNFEFEDVTIESNLMGPADSWTTGTTTADINGDGKMDIYVSMLGKHLGIFGSNQLYINQGNDENGVPMFKEEGAKYGLDLVGLSTQAAFFDYDLDGDLDMFQLNQSVHSNGTFVEKRLAEEGHPYAGDKLMRNDGGVFVNVSKGAGIKTNQLGFGLGLGISDLNLDGYPDIYVGNDFHEDDYLYINNGDGTFTESLSDQMRLTSRYSMGNDIADINNDGYPDVFSADMLPSDYQVLKASQTEDNFQIFDMKRRLGYGYQYSRNTLQLNNGNSTFSEIGLYAKLAATDWSWCPLIADFDLDGKQEIFITNGIVKRPNDLDYLNYVIADQQRATRSNEGVTRLEDMKVIDLMPELKIANALFTQTADLIFEDQAQAWGLGDLTYSSGAAYADFDNDGDLDLVINNTNEEALLYRNNTLANDAENEARFINIKLENRGANPNGVGSKINLILEDGQIISRELFASRGFQSSVSSIIHIGLPEDARISELSIRWPDQTRQIVENPILNQLNVVSKSGSTKRDETLIGETQFLSLDSLTGLTYTHIENTSFNEFVREALILHSQATDGPGIAVGDMDGNGYEDVYIGGAKGQSGKLYLQFNGEFKLSQQDVFEQDKLQEDVQAEWVDIDSDGDLDLAVLTGGNEFYRGEEALKPKIYLNKDGQLIRKSNAFNGINLTGGAMAFNDFNKDGFVDAFVGGRVKQWNYGIFPDSYFLINDGEGNLILDTDITSSMSQLGMVRDAAWGDIDGDGWDDLVVAGDWFPVAIFISDGQSLKKADPRDYGLEKNNGYWSSIQLEDLNSDGRLDMILGNLGTNTKITASADKPMQMFIKDFDDNGKIEHLIYTYREGEYKLFPTKDELTSQLISLKKKFVNYQEYSRAAQDEIIPSEWKNGAIKREIHELRSCIFINSDEGWIKQPLPMQAQLSPIHSIHVLDIDGDDRLDLLTGGNLYAVSTQIGKYDGSYGNVFLNAGDGSFNSISNKLSGIDIKGEVRAIQSLKYQDKEVLLFAINNGGIKAVTLNKTAP